MRCNVKILYDLLSSNPEVSIILVFFQKSINPVLTKLRRKKVFFIVFYCFS